jgi:8-oxo-dGTP diphosphatase
MKFPLGLKRVASMCILQYQDTTQNKFLLLNRNKAPFINHYVPVGGKLEPHENPMAAVRRETFEETGLQIDNFKFCGMLTESSPIKYNWICYIYLAQIEDIEPPFCDEGTLEWIDFDNILNVPTPPSDWQIYKYILENRPFAFNAIYNENMEMTAMWEEFEGIRVV